MPANNHEELLLDVAKALAEDKEYPIDGTLLYAMLDYNMVGPSIFKESENHIIYRWPDLNRVGNALLRLWEAQADERAWSEIEYLIRDGKFEVTYTYPDEIDPEESWEDRRDRVVKRHFGDKPIVYPPWPPPDDENVFEL